MNNYKTKFYEKKEFYQTIQIMVNKKKPGNSITGLCTAGRTRTGTGI